jgi:hypothetical protein
MSAFFVAAACFAAVGQQPTSPIRTPSASAGPIIRTPSASAGPIRPFAEGVRIDWPNLTVELDAEVALREGPLELFACSPRTKEHESILVVYARPMHIYQALGLIGLNPGSPGRFDEQNQRWEAARGARLDVRVRYPDGSDTRVVASEKWVSGAKGATPEPLPPLRWVFAGSLTLPDGRFAADIEGTVACVVDFESALVALDTSHSADNDQLWLAANTKEIPPRGTKCTLLIRSDHRPTVEVELVDEHTARYKDQSLSAEQLAKILRPPPDDARPGRLYIHPAATVSDEAAKAFVEKVTKSGFEGAIETKRRP